MRCTLSSAGRRRGCSASETIVFHSFTRRNHSSLIHSFSPSSPLSRDSATTTTPNNYSSSSSHQQLHSLLSLSSALSPSSPIRWSPCAQPRPRPNPFPSAARPQPGPLLASFAPDDRPPAPFASSSPVSGPLSLAIPFQRTLPLLFENSVHSLPFLCLPSFSLSLGRIASHRTAAGSQRMT